ncbi:lipopolysaccharide kinase InaA family protein [Methylophaga sp. OBS3]|uniref:lipopolysaccharide kinase InaA family protein n=1 Tax=Methylophaga sp. OBS3 TaxID=2991934 RepID=UPI00224D7755|nr:lipopolysaccharide kinase InaA family protein [Methylophaga sp. OBS3]MCX4190459.1 lipopolysaccharide kinase InaA family protein [Methylophaga sp. OBS3]
MHDQQQGPSRNPTFFSETSNALWMNDSDWFEEPNFRRGGWSGVIKTTLSQAMQADEVFIKRQENHVTRSIMHPISGLPTFFREFRNIKKLQSKYISTLDVIYFEMRASKAIIVTKALVGYVGLDALDLNHLNADERRTLIRDIAIEVRKLHQGHFRHNCLYPKHIMVKPDGDHWSVKLIDLEKLKYSVFSCNATLHDLSSFFRHRPEAWTVKDTVQFFQVYFDEQQLSIETKRIIRLIGKKIWLKDQRQPVGLTGEDLTVNQVTKMQLVFTALQVTFEHFNSQARQGFSRVFRRIAAL